MIINFMFFFLFLTMYCLQDATHTHINFNSTILVYNSKLLFISFFLRMQNNEQNFAFIAKDLSSIKIKTTVLLV